MKNKKILAGPRVYVSVRARMHACMHAGVYRNAYLTDESERRTDIGPDPGRRPGLLSRTKRLRQERLGFKAKGAEGVGRVT